MKFTEQLKALGFASYGEYLQSSHWSNFKKRYRLAGQGMKCLVCGEGPVQLHHHTYVRLGAELFTDVSPLCRPHHEAVHEWLKASGKNFVEHTHKAVIALGGELVTPQKKSRHKPKNMVPDPAVRHLSKSRRKAAKKERAARKAAAKALVAPSKFRSPPKPPDPALAAKETERKRLANILNKSPAPPSFKAKAAQKPRKGAMASHYQKMRGLVTRYIALKKQGLWHDEIPAGYVPRWDDYNLADYVVKLEAKRRAAAG